MSMPYLTSTLARSHARHHLSEAHFWLDCIEVELDDLPRWTTPLSELPGLQAYLQSLWVNVRDELRMYDLAIARAEAWARLERAEMALVRLRLDLG